MKLGVMYSGGPTDGSHLRHSFTGTKLISKWEDLEEDMALLLWGGEDISPTLYGQKPNNFNDAGTIPSTRDQKEWKCIAKAVEMKLPIIGICRGMQMLCAFDGGILAQDVTGHRSGHFIETPTGERFHAQGMHHQMCLPLPHNDVIAFSEFNLTSGMYIGENNEINYFPEDFKEPEAVYFPKIKGLGFQFHPEWGGHTDASVKFAIRSIHHYFL